jgi:hypothetical protein
MRFGSISLLLVLGVMGVTACAGGGSLTANSSAPDEGAYNPVPSVDSLPPVLNPSTYAMPANAYDAPPGQANAGGIGTGATTQSACATLCNDALALNCPVTSSSSDSSGSGGGSNNGNNGNSNAGRGNNGNSSNSGTQNPPAAAAATIVSPDECTAQCVQSFAKVPCPDEFAAAIGCFLDHITLTCDLLQSTSDQSTLEQELTANCQTALIAFASCVESSQGTGQQPQPQRCDPNAGCGGCTDACSRCDCDGDAKSCSACINN